MLSQKCGNGMPGKGGKRTSLSLKWVLQTIVPKYGA
jgi:hypothetical protein